MIYIMRHGQTDLNRQGVLLGRTDIPLNAQGLREAADLAETFRRQGIRFDACYSSPLRRAVQTAEIAADRKPSEMILDDLLLEMDYGPYEGTPLRQPPEEIREFFADFIHHPAPAEMEQLPHVVKRLGAFLEKLSYRPGENVLISTHAIAMKGALEYLTPDSHGSYWNKNIGNCAVYCFDKLSNSFTIPQKYD